MDKKSDKANKATDKQKVIIEYLRELKKRVPKESEDTGSKWLHVRPYKDRKDN